MATALIVQRIVRGSGLLAIYTAATIAGHAFDNSSGDVFLHVKNAGEVPVTVKIDALKAMYDLSVSDLNLVVEAGKERFFGPFPAVPYEQNSVSADIARAVLFNTSVQASVSYAAIQITFEL